MDSSHDHHLHWTVLMVSGISLLLLSALPARANDGQVPWECSGYSGEAKTRCLQTFIELEWEEIGKLKGQLKAQEGTLEQLKQQMDRQAAATADMQRRLATPPAFAPTFPYAYSLYAYPPVGFGLYFGRPWMYGGPYYYPPYFGRHRHFGFHLRPWGRRW
jgi:hypothetical protein